MKTSWLSRTFFLLLFFCSFQLSMGQTRTRLLFIFDASFSMYGDWQTGTKIEVAKKKFISFLDTLKSYPDLEIALRCYGHQFSIRPTPNCTDSKLEIPFADAAANVPLMKKRIQTIVPTGTTPIAYSLGQAAYDFPECSDCRNIVILITDGIEECEGNPCEVSYEYQKKGIILKPFVLGIGLGPLFRETMGCIGKFYDIASEEHFSSILKSVVTEATTRTTVEVDLLDQNKKPLESNVNMTFYDELSGEIKYNYVHTLNHYGRPDTLVVDPLRTYRIVVHTIPKVEKENVKLTIGKHNTIPVNTPQGFLNLTVPGGKTNYKSLQAVIRKPGEKETIHVQDFFTTEKYIVGKYDLEILSLPRIILKNVEIKQSHTNKIEIPQAGVVSISKPSAGNGSVYLETKGKLEWVCNLEDHLVQESIVLQPGNYRVEFRKRTDTDAEKTTEKKFRIESGVSTPVKL